MASKIAKIGKKRIELFKITIAEKNVKMSGNSTRLLFLELTCKNGIDCCCPFCLLAKKRQRGQVLRESKS